MSSEAQLTNLQQMDVLHIRSYTPIEDLRHHVKRNHDKIIRCDVCKSHFCSKTSQMRHLHSLIHLNNLRHQKMAAKGNRQRAPSVTVTISSDEGDEDTKDVYIIEDSERTESGKLEDKTKAVSEVNKSEQDPGSKTESDEKFVKALQIVAGKTTCSGTWCKVCKQMYKHFRIHCKTAKHAQAFKGSKFYAQMNAEGGSKRARKENGSGNEENMVRVGEKVSVEQKHPTGKVVSMGKKLQAEEVEEEMQQSTEHLDDSGVFMSDITKEEDVTITKVEKGFEKLSEGYTTEELLQQNTPVCRSYEIGSFGIATTEVKHEVSAQQLKTVHDSMYATVAQTKKNISQTKEEHTELVPEDLMQSCTSKSVVHGCPSSMCSPTMLVKNISMELEAMEGPQRQNIFETFTDDNRNLPMTVQTASDNTETCTVHIVGDVKEIFNEDQSVGALKSEDLDHCDGSNTLNMVVIDGHLDAKEDDLDIVKDFCVIENVETMSKESFILLDENNNDDSKA